MRFGGRIAGQGSRFGGGNAGRLEDAVRRRLRARLAARSRGNAPSKPGDRSARRRLSLAERLRVIEQAER